MFHVNLRGCGWHTWGTERFFCFPHTHHGLFPKGVYAGEGKVATFIKTTSITFRVPNLTFQNFLPHENQKTHKLDFMGWNQMFCILPIWFRYLFSYLGTKSSRNKKSPKHSPLEATEKPPWELAHFNLAFPKPGKPTNQSAPPKKTGKVKYQAPGKIQKAIRESFWVSHLSKGSNGLPYQPLLPTWCWHQLQVISVINLSPITVLLRIQEAL